MANYEPVIGLEVHAQLKTNTKAFCGCSTEFGNPPNTQTCPVCLGFPGSLPVLNEKSISYGMKVALALDCQVQPYTKFDRKNYFYPDLPKNYQISQYDLPLALNGFLEIDILESKKRIAVRRVHLEEDAGKLIHEMDYSLVDFNRAGIPLLEIVSEPEINSPEEAYEYLISLKAILRYLDVCDCDMEKGSLRCDANISLREYGEKGLGVKTELKNLNSFKAVRDALSYEIKRQKELLEKGSRIAQETLIWDDLNSKTYSMRSKEEAMDYRYFPEPDLPPFVFSGEEIKAIKNTLPELPKVRKNRFISDYGLTSYDAGILTDEKRLADYFEDCHKIYPKPKTIANWLIGPLSFELSSRKLSIENFSLDPKKFSRLLELLDSGAINNLTAKDVLTEMLNTQEGPEEIIKKKDLSQDSDMGRLSGFVDKVIAENKKSAEDYKAGKTNALMFLVGQVMRLTKGKANPKLVQEILKGRLSNA